MSVFNKITFTCLISVLLILTVACGSAKIPATATNESEKQDNPSTEASKPKRIVITYFPYAEHLFAIGEQDAVAGVVGLSSL
ncbi:hypothetical protein HPL003_06190 [Paenibacillus terrae HPL-003]|uniref:Fe/B12 periplasmic-binding domain-containing protein n=1 Tax=Paenibacillus terrae (strain HPL-003) TaxID=985665 RepID=G7W1J7_PAETH|nr:hypothetical protein [Paenibacillus terrae]AET58001.1 hypothetical protein HPL003_06190 [Paenibacillus terrae HPL-003]